MPNTRETEAEDLHSEARGKRRWRSKRERRQIVEESLKPGVSVAVVARRHGVNANQVFHWRKLLREGRLDEVLAATQLMPVRVSDMIQHEMPLVRHYTGTVHVEVGRARIRIEGSADPDSLRMVLEQMSR